MKTNLCYGVPTPQAFITKSKQRLKQYNNIVYLKHGEEFQIELFNPTQEKLLSKILINGQYISMSGIVLRPGERIFLERYLDEPKRFRFDIYSIDAKDIAAMAAIEKNGKVGVHFFTEYKPLTYTYTPGVTYIQPPFITYGVNTVFNTSGSINVTDVKYDNKAHNISSNISVCNNSKIETGRIDKGGYSSQKFDYENTSFNTYYTWNSEWKILPESERLITKKDLKVFCGYCGAKRKKDSYKFCPHCGKNY